MNDIVTKEMNDFMNYMKQVGFELITNGNKEVDEFSKCMLYAIEKSPEDCNINKIGAVGLYLVPSTGYMMFIAYIKTLDIYALDELADTGVLPEDGLTEMTDEVLYRGLFNNKEYAVSVYNSCVKPIIDQEIKDAASFISTIVYIPDEEKEDFLYTVREISEVDYMREELNLDANGLRICNDDGLNHKILEFPGLDKLN